MACNLVGALGALAVACPSATATAPMTLDMVLGLESFGRVAIDPSGSTAVFEERRARGDLPRYDLQPEGALKYARLYRFGLNGPPQVRPLLPMEPDAGYTAGPFSPSGRRLTIYRLQGLSWRLGVIDLGTGVVQWTDVSPELPAWGRSVEWLSEDTLVAIGTPDGSLPSRLARTNAVQARLPIQWERASRGAPAFVSTGLGFPEVPPDLKQLWRINAVTGASTPLSSGPFLDLEASPDGRYIALLQDGPLLPPPDALTATEIRRARSLRVVDIDTGVVVEPPETIDISTGLLSWSPDSTELLVASIDADASRLLAVSTRGRIRDVTPRNFTVDVPVDFFGSPTAQAGWLGGRPVVLGRLQGAQGWYASQSGLASRLPGISAAARLVGQGLAALLFDDDGRILRVRSSLQSQDLGRAAPTSRPDGPLGQRAATSPMKADDAVVSGADGQLCRVRADDLLTLQCVAGEPGSAVSWSQGASLRVGAAGREANILTLRRNSASEILWRLNPELDSVDIAPPHLVTGPGGARGWLYLPHHIGGTPPPVVVIPYQGQTNLIPPRKMRPESVDLAQSGQILVSAGYAVLFPDLPATPEPGTGLAERILAVVDAASAEGLVDGDRIGLWGHSFGAWSSAMSAAQSTRFRAVVALNGSFNFPSVIADMPDVTRIAGDNDAGVTGSARWLESGQASMLQPYWSDQDRYRRNSPFEAADRITTPMLLIHGELDFGPTQSEQMYAALHRLGRPVALTLLFGEDHAIHNPGNARIYYEQVLEWFDRYLRPTGPQDETASAEPKPPSTPD